MSKLNFYKQFCFDKSARVLIYNHMKSVLPRLPEHYKRRYMECQTRPAEVVHMRNKPFNWEQNPDTGAIESTEQSNKPPLVIYPEQSQRALWGGEGVVVGFRQRTPRMQLHPRTWRPSLQQQLFYSEILDRWMKIVVTPRTLNLIEKAKGFDYYILQTHEVDLKSRLGNHLKRDMLLTLASPAENNDRAAVLEKYKQYRIPKEEAEWVGLTLIEAVKKQMTLEHTESLNQRPMKEIFMEAFEKGEAFHEEPLPKPIEKPKGKLDQMKQKILRRK